MGRDAGGLGEEVRRRRNNKQNIILKNLKRF